MNNNKIIKNLKEFDYCVIPNLIDNDEINISKDYFLI
jgi:hypothetical protein